ncbi:MAG: hypothetical protein DHS20C09_07560 [marine bacterium B5-7]|nr:MAG: hypothetical protein DHS20C09_07560 [marine bacterium B5-7]
MSNNYESAGFTRTFENGTEILSITPQLVKGPIDKVRKSYQIRGRHILAVREGFALKDEDDLYISKIESIKLQKSVIGKATNAHNLVFLTGSGAEHIWENVPNAPAVKDFVHALVQAAVINSFSDSSQRDKFDFDSEPGQSAQKVPSQISSEELEELETSVADPITEATSSIEVDLSLIQAWNVVTDMRNSEHWMPGMRHYGVLPPDVSRGSRFKVYLHRMPDREPGEGYVVVTQFKAPLHFAFIDGRLNDFRLEKISEKKTRVHIRLTIPAWKPKNLLYKVPALFQNASYEKDAPSIAKDYASRLDQYCSSLCRHKEHVLDWYEHKNGYSDYLELPTSNYDPLPSELQKFGYLAHYFNTYNVEREAYKQSISSDNSSPYPLASVLEKLTWLDFAAEEHQENSDTAKAYLFSLNSFFTSLGNNTDAEYTAAKSDFWNALWNAKRKACSDDQDEFKKSWDSLNKCWIAFMQEIGESSEPVLFPSEEEFESFIQDFQNSDEESIDISDKNERNASNINRKDHNRYSDEVDMLREQWRLPKDFTSDNLNTEFSARYNSYPEAMRAQLRTEYEVLEGFTATGT